MTNKIQINVDDDVKKKFKSQVALKDKTISEFLRKCINKFLISPKETIEFINKT